MGGVYGEINSRTDFERALREAMGIANRILSSGRNPVIQAVVEQLGAMSRASEGGREPSQDERRSVNVGLIAVRELDADRQDDSGLLARKLYALDSYFREWPTDEQATSATDADFWRRFGL
jgi:hypothetical protein